MKKGVFFDRLMDDPRKGRDTDESSVNRYLMNLAIAESLRADYDIETYGNIFEASSRIHNASPDRTVDFFVTDIAYSQGTKEWVKELNTQIRRSMRGIDKLSIEERSRIVAYLMREEQRFLDRAYSESMYCLSQLHKHNRNLAIIAFTLAPDYICNKCVDEGSIDQLLFRNIPNPGYAATRLRRLIEAGR